MEWHHLTFTPILHSCKQLRNFWCDDTDATLGCLACLEFLNTGDADYDVRFRIRVGSQCLQAVLIPLCTALDRRVFAQDNQDSTTPGLVCENPGESEL